MYQTLVFNEVLADATKIQKGACSNHDFVVYRLNIDCLRVVCDQLYREADLQEEKLRILRSLGSASDVALLKRTLDFSLSVSLVIQCLFETSMLLV